MRIEQQRALERGIKLFNEGRYFEAHEEWESEWRLMDRRGERAFFQGLIMAAGAFLHYVRQECRGARELLERSMAALQGGIEDHPDLGLEEFIGGLERLRNAIDACTFTVAQADLPVIRRRAVEGSRMIAWKGRQGREEG